MFGFVGLDVEAVDDKDLTLGEFHGQHRLGSLPNNPLRKPLPPIARTNWVAETTLESLRRRPPTQPRATGLDLGADLLVTFIFIEE